MIFYFLIGVGCKCHDAFSLIVEEKKEEKKKEESEEESDDDMGFGKYFILELFQSSTLSAAVASSDWEDGARR